MSSTDESAQCSDPSLASFLSSQRSAYLSALSSGTADEWIIATGNEAGDLDSLASAIAYAYYSSKLAPHPAPTVPLAHMARADLALRAENLHALARAGLDPAAPPLLFTDDLPEPLPTHMFALVDHNRLHPRFDRPGARVVAIVDHHADEGHHTDADPRIVQVPVGSCASLVAQLLAAHAESVPPALATLLLSAIAVDTNGLAPRGKTTPADTAAASFLLPRSTLAPSAAFAPDAPHTHPALQALSAALAAHKAGVAHLGTRDLLRRDYKEYTLAARGAPVRAGLASVPLGLRAWLARDGPAFARGAEAWMAERGLAVLGVLTSWRDAEKPGKSGRGKHRREQAWVVRCDAEGGKLAKRLFRGLEESEELRLKAEAWEEVGLREGFGEGYEARVYKQKNTDATRKVTAPLMQKIIESPKKDASL
ncbi:DHH phosphoesterase [Obba rivulosa]|uniref:DHH phosphoesterase n=1 Tax=Obba rivulosa TaxID=1052685 RepID=A0A8E2J4I6_9APHY|nr:DHH phosphoesterase [Obba rivulosa]